MIRTLDLFCGGGGSSYGARAAGAQIICGVDANPLAMAVFAANFPTAHAATMHLTNRTGPEAITGLGKIDLLLASPECTNHTCARGSRPRDENSRNTATYVLQFAATLQPRWLVIENVIHMRSWAGYEPLLGSLRNLGYNLRIEILDASRFGVPQSRRRLFIMGDRERMPPRVARARGRPPHAKSVLAHPDTWLSQPLYKAGRAAATLLRAERGMHELGRDRPFLIVYYGSDGGGGWQPLERPLRTITTLDRFGLVTWQDQQPVLRMLQVPELQAAMGFGPDYKLDTLRQRREQIRILGNGVAPPVMSSIISSLTNEDRHDAELPLRLGKGRYIMNRDWHQEAA